MWGAKDASGLHTNYTFENLTLDNWYSLVQMEQEQPGLKGFTFRNIWALDQPPLADSSITGDVTGVTFDNVKYGQARAAGNADLPMNVNDGAQQPHFTATHKPDAEFSVDTPVFAPGQQVSFTAKASPGARYTWLFGDGTTEHGRHVQTSLSGCGRHRTRRCERRRPFQGFASCRGQGRAAGLGCAGRCGRGKMARCRNSGGTNGWRA